MEPLYVAKPLMPDLADLNVLLQEVWESGIVTNEGPLSRRLESELAERLEVPVAKLFCNGTVALQCALLSQDFPVGSEIITTPLTFAATAHVITACGLRPVFADVDAETLTLDPEAVERAITSRTRAVLGVHVYGTLCDHKRLQAVCDAAGLKLIYDAAHAFASSLHDMPVGRMGNMTMFSLHATKLFNSFEGGLITSNDPEDAHRLRLARNFGIESEERVNSVGINGKMNEVNAAIGLLNLKLFEQEREARADLRAAYNRIVERFPGLRKQPVQAGVKQSEQYYALQVDPARFGASRDDIYDALKVRQIFSRRYFWPICTDFECYRQEPIHSVHPTPIVEIIKDRVLCLPFHSGVKSHHIQIIESVFDELSESSFKRKLSLENTNV